MIRRSRFVEQWVPHDGVVWKVWLVRTWVMRLLFIPAEYVVTEDDKVVGFFKDLPKSQKFIRGEMAKDNTQVPVHLLPTHLQRYVLECQKHHVIHLGESALRRDEALDLIKYGWIKPNSGGNFKMVVAK